MSIITLSIITILASFALSVFVYKKEPTLLKKVYTTNLIDYVLGPVLLLSVFGIAFLLSKANLPSFLTFSLANLIDMKSTSIGLSSLIVNLDKTPSNLSLLLITSISLIFCLPALSYAEEFAFRYEISDLKTRLLKSFSFGMIHLFVGIPVFIALILSIVGFIFSLRYVKSYRNARKTSAKGIHHDIALLSSTSLHAKYNLSIIVGLIIYLSTSYLK